MRFSSPIFLESEDLRQIFYEYSRIHFLALFFSCVWEGECQEYFLGRIFKFFVMGNRTIYFELIAIKDELEDVTKPANSKRLKLGDVTYTLSLSGDNLISDKLLPEEYQTVLDNDVNFTI